MSSREAWEAYFQPGTIDADGNGVLRNRPGLTDPAALDALEARLVRIRATQLWVNQDYIPRTYDAAHLQAIHQHLFKDLYDWAGQFRTVPMGKNHQAFDTPGAEQFTQRLEHVTATVQGTDWQRQDKIGFAETLSEVYANINQAHPFREGNGRTGRIFLEHVAQLSPHYQLDLTRVDRMEWNFASVRSAPAPETTAVRPEQMRGVFWGATVGSRPGDPESIPLTRAEELTRSLSRGEKLRNLIEPSEAAQAMRKILQEQDDAPVAGKPQHDRARTIPQQRGPRPAR